MNYSEREHQIALDKLAADMEKDKAHALLYATHGAKLPPVSLEHVNTDSGAGLPELSTDAPRATDGPLSSEGGEM